MLNIRNLVLNYYYKCPVHIRSYIDIIRRCNIWKSQGVIFIHVPKAAGVSVSIALYGRPLGHFYAKDIQSLCPKTFNNLFTFSVVRHPVDRLYSAFRFARTGGTTVMGMQNPSYYVNHPDFVSFERFVTNWLAKQDLSKIDGVFRPQFLYLFDDNNKLLVDSFYKLEKIELSYEDISKNIGNPFSLGHHNQSEKGELDITDDLKSIIYKLYQKDFELLGYSLQVNQ